GGRSRRRTRSTRSTRSTRTSDICAARARPDLTPRRRARIRSAWELLPEVAPELTEWGAHFAAGAPRRARAEAGIQGAATPRDADDLIRDVEMFVRLVERLLSLQPVLPRQPEGRERDRDFPHAG
ncbi:SAV_6107 family HEPN domain-containing protein, partial [Streptomyces sp. S6]